MKPIYDLYLQKLIIENFKYHNDIKYDDLLQFIIHRNPIKEVAKLILKEMECHGLIKINGKFQAMKVDVINPHNIKVFDNISMIYHRLGCW